MNKKQVLWILLDLVFIIVFNVVFFVAGGTEHKASVWISYAFIHVAYIMLVITPFLVRKTTNKAVLGFPLYSISAGYFIVAFLVGVVFSIIKLDSYKVPLIVQVIIAGIYAILLIANLIANESTAESVEKHEAELQYVKVSSAKLKGIMDSIDDKKLRKKVEKIYDLIHSSPAKSSSEVYDIEKSIMSYIDALENQARNKNTEALEGTINEIEILANDRNRKLKAQYK